MTGSWANPKSTLSTADMSILTQDKHSKSELIALLSASERAKWMRSLTDDQKKYLFYDWSFWARPSQAIPQGDWPIWLIMAGRGFGKTRSGAEFIRQKVEDGARRIALVARTPADARDVMIEGESGLLAISPPWDMPFYEPSKRRLTWSNGAMALVFSGEQPEQLRGPQFDTAWADELRTWQYPRETWDNLMFAVRLGRINQTVVTTTPKPIGVIKELLEREDVVKTFGTTYENFANLSPGFIREIIGKYENTSLGAQEIYARMLSEMPGSLWSRELIEQTRRRVAGHLTRIAIGVDPEASSSEQSAETGICISAVDDEKHGYVLGDYSVRGTPKVWGQKVVNAYHDFQANVIMAEDNNGGEMVEYVIKTIDPTVNVKRIHASKSKQARAEPIASLYEQGFIHHCGLFEQLEDQLCTWVPGEGPSPDRLDALVWSLTELMLGGVPGYLSWIEDQIKAKIA